MQGGCRSADDASTQETIIHPQQLGRALVVGLVGSSVFAAVGEQLDCSCGIIYLCRGGRTTGLQLLWGADTIGYFQTPIQLSI